MNKTAYRLQSKTIGFSFLLFLILSLGVFGFAQTNESPLPAPQGLVNDYAEILDAPTKTRIENRLQKLKSSTNPSIEFGVAIVRTTGGVEIFDYSLKVARGWGIGADVEGDNPGLLFVVAVDDRKAFAQISRDLEGDLTDGESGQIQRNLFVPAARAGNYAKGVEDTINGFIENIAQTRGFDAAEVIGATTRPAPRRRERIQPTQSSAVVGCCIIGAIILFIIISMFGRSNRGGRGGGFGGGGGLLEGLLIGSVLSNLTGNSGGGGWSGGSFGGSGGGDSGGWGGFGGGGDFGGGGAGSDW